ncbi:MAG TPA: sterol desaturase family protein [Kofleriaceae bacterium]
MRQLASYVVFPALVFGPLLVAHAARMHGLPDLIILVGCITACLCVQRVLERVMPYRREWNDRTRARDDIACMALNAITKHGVDLVLGATVFVITAHLTSLYNLALWPTSWPLPVQLAAVILLADLGHYIAHRAMHDVPWLWAFHRMHHSPNSLDSLNFFRMHPLDIVLKTVANSVPLIVLGVPDDVLLLWMVLSGVAAGALNHANIVMRTGLFDGILSTPRLHRFHHSRRHPEQRCNVGNITVIYDRLFGTYCCPRDHDVGEVGEPGGARPLVSELLQPFTGAERR